MPTAPFSLVDGGPLCRLFRRLGCVRPDGQTNYRKAAFLIVAVTWGPLIVLALAESVMTGRTPVIDWGIHARLLVAIPLLFQAEASLRMRTRRAIDLFRSERWAGDHGQLVSKLPGLKRYVQNHAVLEAYGVATRPMTHDGFSELWFDDLASLQAAAQTPEWQAVREDGKLLFAEPIGLVIARERIQKELPQDHR